MSGFNSGFGGGVNMGFVPGFMQLFFILFIGVFIFIIASAVRQGIKNNNSPVLTVVARIVAKRTDVSSDMQNTGDGMNMHSSSTRYYVTFEVESGDRMEFSVRGSEFGLLAEDDSGKLTFQGTRYLGFIRDQG